MTGAVYGGIPMCMNTHLIALRRRRSNEQARLDAAKSAKEREFRAHVVAMCDKEIASEIALYGEDVLPEMSDEDMLAELGV